MKVLIGLVLAALVGCSCSFGTATLSDRERFELDCLRELHKAIRAFAENEGNDNLWARVGAYYLDCEDVAQGIENGRFLFREDLRRRAAR